MALEACCLDSWVQVLHSSEAAMHHLAFRAQSWSGSCVAMACAVTSGRVHSGHPFLLVPVALLDRLARLVLLVHLPSPDLVHPVPLEASALTY